MADALWIVLAVVVAWLATAALASALALRRLRRANRVSPHVRSPAPVWWLWSTSGCARMHRRLQAAVWSVDPARPGADLVPAVGTDELRSDVVAAALHTDDALAGLRRAPRRVRRATLPNLTHRVAVIEDVAGRLAERPPPRPPLRLLLLPSPPPDDDLRALEERVRHLEHGRAEVRRWEGPAVAGR